MKGKTVSRNVRAMNLIASRIMGLTAVAMPGWTAWCWAQAPVIESFDRNGVLICANLAPGSEAVVEWASSVEGPWTNSWAGLEAVEVDSNGTIRVRVPMFYRTNVAMFYRVSGVPPNPDPARLTFIPPGTFRMGSPRSEAERTSDETQHEVTLTQGIWMGRYEVTQGEYLDVIGSNPSSWRNGQAASSSGSGGAVTNELLHPVEQVSWDDATNYCARLTEREFLAGRIPAGYRYRLPTEAEWEYACRAGTTNAFHFGAELRSAMASFDATEEYAASVGSISNPSGVFLGRTAEVGSYEPNAFGLYDMHGNVWEWCQDWYGTYATTPVIDPQGSAMGFVRVLRGGSWTSIGWLCRSAFRLGRNSSVRVNDFGFRVVLAPGPASVP